MDPKELLKEWDANQNECARLVAQRDELNAQLYLLQLKTESLKRDMTLVLPALRKKLCACATGLGLPEELRQMLKREEAAK